MLVLESTWDYQRFGLDQRSLADILTVGPGGLDVLARSRPAVTQPASPPKSASRLDEADIQRLQSLAYVGGTPGPATGAADGRAAAAEEPMPAGVSESVEGGVPGSVSGGVAGGVVGGVPGGVPSGERQEVVQ